MAFRSGNTFVGCVDKRQTLAYNGIMKIIRWNHGKNEWLIHNRGVCFEQALLILERDEALDVVEHPNRKKYPGQKLVIVNIDDYAYLVTYTEDDEEIFLKTMIPSRKATDKYLRGKR